MQLVGIMRRTGENDNVPFDLLRYLIGDLNYGGRISKKEDQFKLHELLRTFISKRTIDIPGFNLSGLD